MKSWTDGTLIFVFILLIPLVLLFLQPNKSAMIILTIISASMFFVAGANWKHLMLAAVAGVILFLVVIFASPYSRQRIETFMNHTDLQGEGYQVQQALIAVSSGGITGVGLGHSRQKGLFLPEPQGDSIFAILSEELGLIGSLFTVILFLLLVWQGLRIAKNAPDLFGKLLATGITVWIATQFFVNVMAITALIPLTGVTLPFISQGGSSLIMILVAVGILQSISRQTTKL